MRLVCVSVCAVMLAASVTVVAQSAPRRDGRWEVTTVIQMPNMPPGMMVPSTQIQCITKADAADPQKWLAGPPQRQGGPGQQCKITDQKTVGNKITWAMACDGPMAMTGTGEMTYSTADTYAGNLVMNGARGGMPIAMNIKLNGKRLGDCEP
jgi:hypothetical protein